MSKLKIDLEIKKALRKKHTRFMVFNEYANCVNIFNLNKPKAASYRIDLKDRLISDGYGGCHLRQFQEFEGRDRYNVFIGSWRD